MSIRAIIFGVTGMVGEGVLHECLRHKDVHSVLVINRRPCGVVHEKLKEIIHADFLDLSPIADQLSGYNAGFFCMGVSSVGMKEADYRRITYDLTMHVGETLVKCNPAMVFCYVSGVGTDSSEQGRQMWARVKGKTENDLMKLPFKGAFMFRPGYIQPTPGLKNAYRIYKFTAPLYPLLKVVAKRFVCTLEEIGLAMINATLRGFHKRVLECEDITTAARQGNSQ
jgi:nucleoside-diphosphate-sugar epimerase